MRIFRRDGVLVGRGLRMLRFARSCRFATVPLADCMDPCFVLVGSDVWGPWFAHAARCLHYVGVRKTERESEVKKLVLA